jgi:hypothetical protein
MEKSDGTVYRQPKLAILNSEINETYKAQLSGETSDVILVAIGDPVKTRTGDTQVPFLLVQKRNDVRGAGVDDEASFFRGWGSRLVRHFGNATPAQLAKQNLKVGSIIAGASIAVKRGLKPFFKKADGSPQDPMQYPAGSVRAGELITSNGQAVYEDTIFVFGEPTHEGMNLVLDPLNVVTVKKPMAAGVTA